MFGGVRVFDCVVEFGGELEVVVVVQTKLNRRFQHLNQPTSDFLPPHHPTHLTHYPCPNFKQRPMILALSELHLVQSPSLLHID